MNLEAEEEYNQIKKNIESDMRLLKYAKISFWVLIILSIPFCIWLGKIKGLI